MIQPGVPDDLPFTIRDYKPEDYPFILSSWSNEARSIKYDSFISNSIYYPRQKALINAILSKSIIKVAHLDDEEDTIGGFAVMEPAFHMNTLFIHWVGVKPLYRRIGICRALINNYLQGADPILTVTSPFSLLPKFKEKYGLIYDPSVIDPLRAIK